MNKELKNMSKSVLAMIILIAAQSNSCERNQAFIEQPDPRSAVAPFGRQVQLNCSVAEGYSIRDWKIRDRNVSGDLSLLIDGLRILTNRGITGVIAPNGRSTQLTVNSTGENNGISIVCESTKDGQQDIVPSCQVIVIFYGPPSVPSNLTAVENGIGSLNISWSFSAIERVEFNFTLNVTNLNASNTEPLTERGIRNLYYIFTDNSPNCDVYRFQVSALNEAGVTNSNEIITRSLPSLPDISAVEDSLQHSLAKADTLIVQFNESTTCPAYPVMKYTLVLVDSEGNRRNETSLSLTGNLSISGLMENTCYTYYIVAVNSIGNQTSSSRSIIYRDNTTGGMMMCPSTTGPPSTAMPPGPNMDVAAIVVPVIAILLLGLIIIIAVLILLRYKGIWNRDKQVKAGSQQRVDVVPLSDQSKLKLKEDITPKEETETAVYSMPYKKSCEMKVDSTLREPRSVNTAQSEGVSDPVYNTLSEEASNEKPAGGKSTDCATYSSLNLGPIYQVLERPEEKRTTDKRISADPTAPPIPVFCPSGGDSPTPQTIEYAEVGHKL